MKQFPFPYVGVYPSYIQRFFNVWEGIGEKTLSTFLHSSWERGRVNLILLPNVAVDVR